MTCVRQIKIIFLVLWLCCLGGFSPAHAERETNSSVVRIGVLAKRGEAKVFERWQATATYLSEKNPGYHFIIIPLGFDRIYEAVERAEVDFVLANSAYFASLERKYGVEALVTMENSRLGQSLTSFGGVIFTRADRDDLNGHDDFVGKSFLAVDERSFGGYHMAWFHLLQHGFDPHEKFSSIAFAGTHDGVVNGVLAGTVDLGTVRSDTLERMADEGKINLEDIKVFQNEKEKPEGFPFLLTTDVYPEWPMASLAHVNPRLAEAVTLALMLMSPGDKAATDAHINGWTIALSYLPVHECLMGLRVEPYAELNTISMADVFHRYSSLLLLSAIAFGFILVFTLFLNRAKIALEKELYLKKKTEKELRQFKTTLDQIHDSVFLFAPETLALHYVNKSGVRQTGFSRNELLGMNFIDLLVEYSDTQFRGILLPLFSGAQSMMSLDTGYWHKDNYLVPVAITLQYISPEEGRDYFVAIMRDKRGENAEAEQFRRLFESSMDAIMIIGPDGYLDCNRRALEIFGYGTKNEFLCLHPGDVSPEKQPGGESSFDLANEKINEALENKVALFEWLHQRQNGTLFPAEVLLSPFERDGEMVIHAVVRDVTERRNAEKEKGKLQAKLLHAQKLEAVGQLAAGIAHEINTPTQYVANNISFLAEVIEDVQELVEEFVQLLSLAKKNGSLTSGQIKQAEDLLEDVGWSELAIEIPDAIAQSKEGLKRVTSIVQAMKEFSHPGSKEKADTDINQVISTTVTVARNEWKYVAEMEVHLAEDLPLISCLSDEIGQVILNMIVNGAHAIAERLGKNSEEKGRIVLQTSSDNEGVEIMITDTGNGIPEDILPRIFDPFFTTKKVGKGTGQGLAICHDVVTEKHGGSLTCESRVGVGTTFIIRLPFAVMEEQA